ncbi:MAG TPA: transglutaminase domain-containing protein, partial [Pyrinomonadaceae bacterium]|nr:transglutaminase domain-containing protein [Pyrinomonadaceae bacterium]
MLLQLPASEFALPLSQIEATKNDLSIRAALEVGLMRHEKLPSEPLLRLLNSPNNDVARLALEMLGNSGSLADVLKIEARITQQSKAQSQSQAISTAELVLAVQKIRLREQIATANASEREGIIKKALNDPKLADWAWVNFSKEENATNGDRTNNAIKTTPTISPLAENVLPANVTLYAALPNPNASFDRISEALNAIQMDTARQQADLVLIMNAMRLQMAAQVNAEPGQPLNQYLGIDGTAPAVFARWNAEDAPRGIPSAVRHAIFLRILDRERFERVFGLYQRSAGSTELLTEYVGGGVRFLGMLPGAFPMVAKTILEDKLEKPKDFTILRLGFVGSTQWNGYPIKTIEDDRIDSAGHFLHDTAYLTYLGETALVTPDLNSLQEVLGRAATTKPNLATNQQFRNAADAGGDAFYLSNLPELFAAPGEKGDFPAVESGSLKITNSVWENLFQLKFPEGDWSKPLVKFKPDELAAPRDLLPATSFGYFITRIDAGKAWPAWNTVFSAEEQIFKSNWKADFERDVLPELGPECGIAAVGVPNLSGDNWDVPLVMFFQLRSDKLAELFAKGALLNGNQANQNTTKFKLGTLDGLATIRNGFLVIANNQAALDALDGKNKLSSSPDYNKTVKRAPDNLVAFAGLNQDAGVEAITKSVNDPEKQRQLSILFSIAKAFHSQSLYATADTNGVDAHFSTLIGREGRYSVAELSSLAKDQVLTFAIIEPRGVPISNQRELKHMRLRMRTRASGEADRLASDISSATQKVVKKSDEELEVTIQPRRVVPAQKIDLPITDPAMARYLESTRDVRANDPSVAAKAREIAGNDRDAWRVAKKLGEWTYKNLTWKRVDAADAAQTLATREADCTEFSQLYVAMARSLGLPARTVSGLAHSGSAFGGHAWVEVFIGQWIELDPTFGTDFVDATHIRDTTGGLLT